MSCPGIIAEAMRGPAIIWLAMAGLIGPPVLSVGWASMPSSSISAFSCNGLDTSGASAFSPEVSNFLPFRLGD